MLLDKVVAMGMTLGFDVPGPPDDYVESPTYRIDDIVLIKWHMNFTDALLKLVYTPNDHTSHSSYIISGKRRGNISIPLSIRVRSKDHKNLLIIRATSGR
ncbi:hypothetical protein F5X98DRAFT_339166 [Xylaria grammica]|nr:hypothetical protein F5X98DRAFT_339166 [Xylaria grammica]